MAANPALLRGVDGALMPTPFVGEIVALRRGGISITLDNLRTASGRWSSHGVLYLTNLRLVFVADVMDRHSGLAAFDLPLAYIQDDRFNQPILGANNLSGKCWPAVPGGGPGGSQPPHNFVLYFKEGGVGTFLPLFFQYIEYIRTASRAPAAPPERTPAASLSSVQPTPDSLKTAFVDPSDPTKLFLAQPVSEADRIPSAPVYAPDYEDTQHERYEDMGLRP